ncbi:hypothetical protein [Mycetocola saprophilus]|uniref:hypothetical protein n=1 Tax=Mycetocola saprophilus TaxID=76636 RepID=UPI0004C11A52|nr:hypothetical protein [Mycetocola saprophilus]
MLALIPLALTLTACAEQGTSPVTGEVPAFTGPWAEEFARSYRDAPDDRIREILRDGVITDAEHAEVEQTYRSCAAERGVHISDVRFDGSSNYEWDSSITVDQAHTFETECSISSGDASVSSLWYAMRRNPDRADENEIVLACVKRVGALDDNFTLEHWNASSYEEKLQALDGADDSAEVFDSCRIDPFGAK